mmetsp:Transcript_39684/g.66603  ORF Transcript_39684/g.66603 Transcript_39684/m.66603 type:complete len:206 (+) Transcript_39684:442-1059(+)
MYIPYSAERISAAPLMVKAPPSSKFKTFTTPSSMSIEYRRERIPRPLSVRSSSTPRAFVKSALPSASIITLSSAPTDFPHASITKASFTATHPIISTPLALISAACSMKPGRCFKLQVGVKAPGTANSTTLFPAQTSATFKVAMFPSLSKYDRLTSSGILSPTDSAETCTDFLPGIATREVAERPCLWPVNARDFTDFIVTDARA